MQGPGLEAPGSNVARRAVQKAKETTEHLPFTSWAEILPEQFGR